MLSETLPTGLQDAIHGFLDDILILSLFLSVHPLPPSLSAYLLVYTSLWHLSPAFHMTYGSKVLTSSVRETLCHTSC